MKRNGSEIGFVRVGEGEGSPDWTKLLLAELRLCVQLRRRTKYFAIEYVVSLSVVVSCLNVVGGLMKEANWPLRHTERIGGFVIW